jgi:hypothetical protein
LRGERPRLGREDVIRLEAGRDDGNSDHRQNFIPACRVWVVCRSFVMGRSRLGPV